MKFDLKETYDVLVKHWEMNLDTESGMIFGEFAGYSVQIFAPENNPFAFTLSFSVCRESAPLENGVFDTLANQYECMESIKVNVNQIQVSAKPYTAFDIGWDDSKLINSVKESLQVMTDFFKENGYKNCCQKCGRIVETMSYIRSDNPLQICADCHHEMEAAYLAQKQREELEKAAHMEAVQENVAGGTIGALLGALAGAFGVIFLAQIGTTKLFIYIMALAGTVVSKCALKGYEYFGKKISPKGIKISLALMSVVTLIAYYLTWTFYIVRGFDWSFGYAFFSLPGVVANGMLNLRAVYIGLVLCVGGIIAAIIITIRSRKKEEEKKKVRKLGQ